MPEFSLQPLGALTKVTSVGSSSVITTPVASVAPRFETSNLYVTLLSTAALEASMPPIRVFVIVTSACWIFIAGADTVNGTVV